jgi:8-oxo-dGTP pyrophosphatase MutT (NUDIX family)
MIREISAGGVVVQPRKGIWQIAAIELPPAAPPAAPLPARGGVKAKAVLCLPKGLVDPGEKPLDAALREVREETGLIAVPVTKLADIKYVYTRSWSDGERVFKIVSFYLLRYQSGRINDISPEMRLEVGRALWLPLDEVPKLLAYKGEKDVARRALEYVSTHTEL